MHPRANARLRPTISPTLPPVIISDAITSVYIVIAVWIPVTVVSRSLATVAIAVFITVVSSAITNWPAASVARTTPVAPAARPDFVIDAAPPDGPSVYEILGPRFHATGRGRVGRLQRRSHRRFACQEHSRRSHDDECCNARGPALRLALVSRSMT